MALNVSHALVTRRFGGGLGNRLKRLVSAILNCEQVYTDDPIYREILALNLRHPIANIDYRVFSGWRLDVAELFPEVVGRGMLNLKLISDHEDHKQRNSIDYEYFGIPLKVRYRVSQAFQLLGMSHEVENRFQRVHSSIGQDLTIGCHIRTWLPQNQKFNTQYFDLKKFELEISRRNDLAKIYLATDSPSIESYFIEKYGSRVVCQSQYFSLIDDRHVTMDPIEPMHQALRENAIAAYVDMLALGACHSLIGSSFSTFTECAWWLGGASQPVVII